MQVYWSLANHPRVRQKIADEKGQVARILKSQADNAKRIDEVFLGDALPAADRCGAASLCLKYIRGEESPSEAEGLRGVGGVC